MPVIALALACLVCTGHGSSMHITSGPKQDDTYEKKMILRKGCFRVLAQLKQCWYGYQGQPIKDKLKSGRLTKLQMTCKAIGAACISRLMSEANPPNGRAEAISTLNLFTVLAMFSMVQPPSAAFSPSIPFSIWNPIRTLRCSQLDSVFSVRLQMPESATEGKLDAINRCKLLPSNAQQLQILYGSQQNIADGRVLLCIRDGLAVAAPLGMALDKRCRIITSNLGEVASIQLPNAKRGLFAGLRRACITRALRTVYGNTRIAGVSASNASSFENAAISHQCDIVFLRRGIRQHLALAVAGAAGIVQRIPILGKCLRVATSIGAHLARAQLTPTERPSLTLRLLKMLPWRCQRLGARLWVQAMLHADTAASNRASRSSKQQVTGRHRMRAVSTLPLLSAQDCEAAVTEAEEYARTHGWLTDRHVSYPTTDIPIRELPKLSELWTTQIFPLVAEAFRSTLDLPDGSVVTPLDVFVVKYDHAAQRELAVHRDNGLLTFSLLLSDASDFSGGGTYFETDGAVYRTSQGVGVLHSALVRHAGYPISSGTRYVLVGFCGLSSPHLPMDYASWRFGDPPWYVSSHVVSDEQILGRVWRPGRY